MMPLREQLEESHKDLHQWFLFHQECLLLQHDTLAQQSFHAFADYLGQHIHFENQHILKQDIAADDLRWSVKVYQKEHDKLVSMLARLSQMLDGYYQMQGRRKRLALLEVINYEQSLLHVMEHHEEREEMDLFQWIQQEGEAWLAINQQLTDKYAGLKAELKLYLESN